MAEAVTSTTAPAPKNLRLALVDSLILTKSLILAVHMAAEALPDELQRDAMQDVLDAAEASLQTARDIGEAMLNDQDSAPGRRNSAAHRVLAGEKL